MEVPSTTQLDGVLPHRLDHIASRVSRGRPCGLSSHAEYAGVDCCFGGRKHVSKQLQEAVYSFSMGPLNFMQLRKNVYRKPLATRGLKNCQRQMLAV